MNRVQYTQTLLILGLLADVAWAANDEVSTKEVEVLSPKMREATHTNVIPSYSLAEKRPPISLVINAQRLKPMPRVLSLNHGKHYITAQDLLFISGQHTARAWGIYHPTHTFSQDNQQWVQLKPVALAELKQAGEAMSRLQITELRQEVRVNDIALPLEWSEESQ